MFLTGSQINVISKFANKSDYRHTFRCDTFIVCPKKSVVLLHNTIVDLVH